MNKKLNLLAALILGAAFVMSGCSIPSTQADEIFIHKGGGPFEDKDDKACIEPSSRQVESAFDAYYAYPANQRVYDFSGSVESGSDGDRFTVVSSDGITLSIPGTVSFSLNTKCEVLQKFHNDLGSRYSAYMETDDNGVYQTGSGWLQMLNIYFRPQLDATLDRVAKQYTWQKLRTDLSVKDEINKAVNAELPRLINQQIRGDNEYFIDISANILQPIAPPELVKAQEDVQTAQAQATATEAKAKADAAAALAAAEAQVGQKEAELKVKKIEAEIRLQEVRSYGGAEAYAKYLAIQKGLNPYQPVYGGNLLNQVPTP